MVRALCLGCALLAAPAAPAQVLPPQGTPGTFDLGTWNIEWFGSPTEGPSNNELQFRNVLAVLRQGAIDLWALQEINDPTLFQRLRDSLHVYGLEGVLGPSTSSNPDFDLRLAFVYDPDVVAPTQVGAILTSAAQYFGGRAPLQMRATVTMPDTSFEVRFIALHAKAGATQQDYNDRVEGSTRLKNYTDNLLPTRARFVVMGDFNDELIQSIYASSPSPYRNFLDDDDYLFITEPFDQPGSSGDQNTYCSSSTCSSGSVLDHLVSDDTLGMAYVAGSVGRYTAVLTAISGYTTTTSDHLPVFARFDLGLLTPTEPEAMPSAFAVGAPFPNPFTTQAVLPVMLDAAGLLRVEVIDALGRRVAVLADGLFPAGRHAFPLDGATLAPGLYVVRVTGERHQAAVRLVRLP